MEIRTQVAEALDAKKQVVAYQLLKDYAEKNSDTPKEDWYHRSMFIASWYARKFDEGRMSIDKLMFTGSPSSEEGHRNYHWYVQTLPTTLIEFSDQFMCHLGNIREPGNPVQVIYFPSNPCITRIDEGYLVNVRFVNYLVIEGSYPTTSQKCMVKTMNSQLRLDKNFKEIGYKDVKDDERKKFICTISGIEDIRLKPGSSYEDVTFIGTVCDYRHHPNGSHSIARMIYGKMKEAQIMSSFIPEIPSANRCEKNWSFIEDDERVLYGFEYYEGRTTLILVKPNVAKFEPIRIPQKVPFNASFLRGSTPLIKFKGGYIAIFHHVTNDHRLPHNENARCYYHRFVVFDSDLQVTHISHAFVIENISIQYIPGLCISHDEEHFILSLSLNDRTSQLRQVAISDVLDSSFMVDINEIASLR